MGLGIAMRAFTASLFNRDVAERLRVAMADIKQNGVEPLSLPSPSQGSTVESPRPSTQSPETKSDPVQATRSEAVTLLSALQREARLVDLIQEDLTQYSDAQVGAAARPCLQSCSKVLARMFEIESLSDAQEGTTIEVDADNTTRYQWIGDVPTADPNPMSDKTMTTVTLVHRGWRAKKQALPTWTGDVADADVIAAAQVQA